MKRYLAIFTVLALLVIAACATSAVATPTNMPARMARSTMAPKPTSSTEVASAPQIAIENFVFAPTTLTVAVGTTVTWVNHDDDLHTVTSCDSLFSSPGVDTGDGFSYRLIAPGTYAFFLRSTPAYDRHDHREVTAKEDTMKDSTIPNPDDHNQDDQHADGMKRRGFLACMAWTGTGLVWTLTSGILSSSILGQPAARMLGAEQPVRGDFSFVQISDTPIGFKGEANPPELQGSGPGQPRPGATGLAQERCRKAPQPAPGTTPSPGPMKVPADQLRRVLGIREVHYVQGQSPLAIVDLTLV